MSLPIIDKNILEFPDPNLALREPDGLLAMGGDLSTARLLQSYSQGIFPWFNAGDPILWWSPDPRAVLFPEELSINRSLKRVLKKQPFEFHINRDFEAVIQACAAPRDDTDESWITQEMKDAYIALHQLGHAHSYECWQNGKLAGGLYGVRIGQAFFAESMFHTVSNASKVAIVHLCQDMGRNKDAIIDIQIMSPHLQKLGAKEISRQNYLENLAHYCAL